MSLNLLSNKISLVSLLPNPASGKSKPEEAKVPETDGPIAYFRNKPLPKAATEKKPVTSAATEPDSSGTDLKQTAIDAAEKAAASAQTEEELRNAIAALEAASKIESTPRTSPTVSDPILQRYRPDLGLPPASNDQTSLGKLSLSDQNGEAANLVSLQSRQTMLFQSIGLQPQSLLSLFV